MTTRIVGLKAASCLLCLVSACAGTQRDRVTPLSPSVVNADPSAYDGKQVAIVGYIILGPETHVMYESRALHEEFGRKFDKNPPDFDPKSYSRYCLTLDNSKFLDQHRSTFSGRTLRLKGVFKSNYLDGSIVDLGACPLPTALSLDEKDVEDLYKKLTAR